MDTSNGRSRAGSSSVSAIADDIVLALSQIDARVEPYDWAFAREHEQEIAAHWQRISAGKPAMFNGRVLLQHRLAIENGICRASYFAVDYAAFLTWRDLGHPGPRIRNGFAMAALRAADGAFLCGVMSEHTANPGKVYFAAGTPDLSDTRPDGTLDLAGSVTRELFEETGLQAADVTVSDHWQAVTAPGRIAFMQPVAIALPAEEARALMLQRMALQEEQELADIAIIRDARDAAPLDMPPFMRRYLDHIWNGG